MELADNVTSADLSTELGWLAIHRGNLGALESQNGFCQSHTARRIRTREKVGWQIS